MITTQTENPAVVRERRADRKLAVVTVLVTGLLIGFYVVSSSAAARKKERERERAAADAHRKVIEQARDRRARAMMQRPSLEAARRSIQGMRDNGKIHSFDLDAGTMRVNSFAWSEMGVEEKQAAARLFALACTPPEDAEQLRDVRILSDRDGTLLAEYGPRRGATIHR